MPESVPRTESIELTGYLAPSQPGFVVLHRNQEAEFKMTGLRCAVGDMTQTLAGKSSSDPCRAQERSNTDNTAADVPATLDPGQ